ncbi:putative transcription factor interactor and regulator CCHC(Zn) family protein [Tanacetum coccineum]
MAQAKDLVDDLARGWISEFDSCSAVCCVKLPEGDWDCELRELSIGDLLVANCSLSPGGSGSTKNVIDVNDPLYLHFDDTNGTPLIGLKLTESENYRVWAAALKHCIHSKNKLGFINGKCVKPDPETEPFLAKQWERCNFVVLTWILNCVSTELFIGQVFSSNAKLMWDELAETYDKIDGSIIFNMHYKINTISQNGSKLSDYYHKLNSLWRKYDAMVQLPVCTCDEASSYKDHVQLLKLMLFVMGLDDVYAVGI